MSLLQRRHFPHNINILIACAGFSGKLTQRWLRAGRGCSPAGLGAVGSCKLILPPKGKRPAQRRRVAPSASVTACCNKESSFSLRIPAPWCFRGDCRTGKVGRLPSRPCNSAVQNWKWGGKGSECCCFLTSGGFPTSLRVCRLLQQGHTLDGVSKESCGAQGELCW